VFIETEIEKESLHEGSKPSIAVVVPEQSREVEVQGFLGKTSFDSSQEDSQNIYRPPDQHEIIQVYTVV
jgi:hypothetical protein